MKVFIGSSREAVERGTVGDIACWIERCRHQPVRWDEPGVFPPGEELMSRLKEISQQVDAAVFVFGEDDQVWTRDQRVGQPRDNVLVEFGQFTNSLGDKRVSICREGRTKLPSDLSGRVVIEIAENRRAQAEQELRSWLKSLEKAAAAAGKAPTGPGLLEAQVVALLKKLETVRIEIPLQDPVCLIPSLKALPREGKGLRLKKHGLNLPVRSVFDHILSLAYNADQLLPLCGYNLNGQQIEKLVLYIVFHDLSEILVGDTPEYTDPEEAPLTVRPPEESRNIERAASEFIKYSFSLRLRADFETALKEIDQFESANVATLGGNDPERSAAAKLFYLLDKIDPIIAIWRHFHLLQGLPDFDPDTFILAMDDFFRNPRVAVACQRCDTGQKIGKLVDFLQNSENAKRYCRGEAVLQEMAAATGISQTVLAALIEKRDIEFTEKRWRLRRLESGGA